LNNIAEELGHKRFSKKDNEWKDSYVTTLSHYVEPHLAEKVKLLIEGIEAVKLLRRLTAEAYIRNQNAINRNSRTKCSV
jgi:hypothetical protein